MNHTRHRQKNCTTATDAASTDPATTFEACEKTTGQAMVLPITSARDLGSKPSQCVHHLRVIDFGIGLSHLDSIASCSLMLNLKNARLTQQNPSADASCRSHPWVRWCNIDHPRLATCHQCGQMHDGGPWRIVRVETIAQFTSREMSSQLDSFPLKDMLCQIVRVAKCFSCPTPWRSRIPLQAVESTSVFHLSVLPSENQSFFKFVLHAEHLLKATNLIVQRGFSCAERDTSLDSTPMMKKVATKNRANRPTWTGE